MLKTIWYMCFVNVFIAFRIFCTLLVTVVSGGRVLRKFGNEHTNIKPLHPLVCKGLAMEPGTGHILSMWGGARIFVIFITIYKYIKKLNALFRINHIRNACKEHILT